ncbi:MAG TPA: hypothetical protein VNG51_10940 [Ktedonobacteraceae bacterium]|nr:hypothetical protein [Ktedonobacteraceae bacterium]
MPSVLLRYLLFVSSYSPLALIFFFLFIEQQPIWAGIVLAIGLPGFIIMLVFFLQLAPRLAPIQEKVTSLQGRDGEAMGYIASYLIPFVAIPFGGWQQGVALLIFIGVLSIVYVNSNMIHINPMLNLVGYHLYEITIEHSESPHVLITRRRVVRGETLRLIDVGSGIFLEKGSKVK